MFKKVASIIALSAIATVASTAAAHASSGFGLGVKVDDGSYRGTRKDEGVFKHADDSKFLIVDFNDGKVPSVNGVKYSFSQNSYSTQKYSGKTGIYADHWAPTGANADDNKSNYLAVFQGNDAIIELDGGKVFNYFGLNAGALSKGNTLSFFNGNTVVESFTYEMLNAMATVVSQTHSGERNGFFEFFSRNANENFNKIVISQTVGGGFETDNHVFQVGRGTFKRVTAVPEPGVVFGLLAVGGMVVGQRQNKKDKTKVD